MPSGQASSRRRKSPKSMIQKGSGSGGSKNKKQPEFSSRRSMAARGPGRSGSGQSGSMAGGGTPGGGSVAGRTAKTAKNILSRATDDIRRGGSRAASSAPAKTAKNVLKRAAGLNDRPKQTQEKASPKRKPRGGQQASRGAGTAGSAAHSMRAPTAGEIAKSRTISTSRPAPPQPKPKPRKLPSSK